MVNYSNGKIYKIESITGEGTVYVGSTTKKYLSQRMDEHRRNYKYLLDGRIKGDGKPYKKIRSCELFEKHGIDNCKIVLLESVNAQTKDELSEREAYYIKSLECVNKMIPLRTAKEFYILNRETNIVDIHIREKEYRLKHKDKNALKKKVKYHCECGGICNISHKARHMQCKPHKLYMEQQLI